MADRIEAAEAAVRRGDWRAALDLLDLLDGDSDVAASLELKAQAAYGAGDFEGAIDAWEKLHALELARGDAPAAARAAAMIAMYLMMDTGLMAPVRGWLRAAERLLSGADDTPAHALVAMTRTYERFMCGDMDSAREHAAAAIDLGTRLGVVPAVVIGRVASARVRVFDGDLAGGLGQLDEVGALLLAGGADALTTGMMYCELICAAQGLARFDMAREWTDVMEAWRHGAAIGAINGRCRVHRAEILRVSGPCDLAEAEALGACEELRPWMRREFGWPLVELGNIRLRKGDLAGAEVAFLDAHAHAWSPQPGLALVRLARGDAEGAAAMIADAIEHPFDIPSKERPPFGDLRLAPLFDAQAEIAFQAGDEATVRLAAERLAAIAERFPGSFLQAWSDLAHARAALLTGDSPTAIDEARRAVNAWTDVGAPYEAATARVLLGHAYAAAARPDSARLEWAAAEAAFRAYGAEGRATETRALLDDEARTADAAPTSRSAHASGEDVRFAPDGANRTVVFRGRTSTVRDLKGLRYVARLVTEPGREFHVLDLVATDSGVLRAGAASLDASGVGSRGGDAGLPVLDETARAAYRRRLVEIDEDIDDARRCNDLARIELAERDRDYLVAELVRAVGLGGRGRTVGGTAERARTSVTRSIRYALDQLGAAQPELAAHLGSRVHTGTYCCYRPDPITPLRWMF